MYSTWVTLLASALMILLQCGRGAGSMKRLWLAFLYFSWWWTLHAPWAGLRKCLRHGYLIQLLPYVGENGMIPPIKVSAVMYLCCHGLGMWGMGYHKYWWCYFHFVVQAPTSWRPKNNFAAKQNIELLPVPPHENQKAFIPKVGRWTSWKPSRRSPETSALVFALFRYGILWVWGWWGTFVTYCNQRHLRACDGFVCRRLLEACKSVKSYQLSNGCTLLEYASDNVPRSLRLGPRISSFLILRRTRCPRVLAYVTLYLANKMIRESFPKVLAYATLYFANKMIGESFPRVLA